MRPETKLQRELRATLDKLGFRSVAVPNGATLSGDAKRRAIQMANLKKDGLCVGFPDLIVFGSGGRIGFIEVKCEGGKQSDPQKHVEQWLTEWGHKVAVCRSSLDVMDTLNEWGWI